MRGDLQPSPIDHAIDQLTSYLTAVNDNPESRVLRDKQVDVMQDLQTFLETHRDEPHGYISLPTGVGKTVLFTELVKATGLRTLVLSPTQGLLEQTETAFSRFGDNVKVGKVFAGEKNGDEQITLTTYASFVRQTKSGIGQIRPGGYDLIILDEAHRALAAETHRVLRKYNNAIQVGFTATEDYSEKRRLQSLLPTEIHKMTIVEAIKHGLIAPYSNIIIETGIDVSKVRVTATNEYDNSDLERAINTDRRNLLAAEVYRRYFVGAKAIAFCNGIEHAKSVADCFDRAGIRALAIHGGMSLEEQMTAKDSLGTYGDDKLDILTNDKILTEGFDVPEVVICFNLAPTLSQVRAQQRGGRVLRLDPANPNKHAFIIDFLDQSFRKPPILFSDQRVAGEVMLGEPSYNPFMTGDNTLADGHSKVVVDPQAIKKITDRHYNESRIERKFAPEGWLCAGQVCSIYGMPELHVRTGMGSLVRQDITKTEGFHSPFTTSKSKRYYYHPDLVQQLVQSVGKTYFDFKNTFPSNWISRETFETNYPPRVVETIYRYTRSSNTGLWLDHHISNGESEYFGPSLVRRLHELGKPSKHWLSTEPLQEKFGVSEIELEELHKVLSRREYKLSSQYPLWTMSEGKEKLFVFPGMFTALEAELIRSRDAVDEPNELMEDDTVELRRETSLKRAELLNQLFASAATIEPLKQANVSSAARRPKQTKKQIDALYAEFF